MPVLSPPRPRIRAVWRRHQPAICRPHHTTPAAPFGQHLGPAMNSPAAPEWRPDPLLTIDELAAWLGKPKNTLYAWHSRGKGPRAIRVGNTLRWRRSEVERWLDDHTDAER
ncbi:transcriptional regulator, AlpA family [Micromonospora auratinigra]|uniref:Transcriptional regulator, AlpA family n=2 Tax=Micromonospora auratinigra TaxID=261654 RepID=A0A1A8Z475_9ACTN|nr:transcriptional regulator, AlpA family [Micromonospora auratinigra]